MKKIKFLLSTPDFGRVGVSTPAQAYLILMKLYPDIANKKLAKEHIFRICKSHDENIPFDLGDNKRGFAIGGFGSPVYVSIYKF